MPLLVTSASGANGNGFGALLTFELNGTLSGTFIDDDRIVDPRGLAVHPNENLLFLNSGADRVLAISSHRRIVRDTGRIEGLNPGGGNFGPDGRYFIGSRSTRTIVALSASLDFTVEYLLPPRVVPFPRGFAFGHDGRLFLASGIGPNGQAVTPSWPCSRYGHAASRLVADPELSPLDLAIAPNGVKVDRHFAKGLALLAAYTYSKALDTNSTFLSTNANANIPRNSRDLAAEKRFSDFDHRHRLSFAYSYDLPFGNTVLRTGNHSVNYAIAGWQLSGILTAQSGSVFTPIISGNISGASEEPGDTADRPNLVGNPIPPQQTPNQWISAAAFAPPTPLHFGNAGRNILVGPGLFSWDFAMLRDFRLSEPKALEFRFEIFNLTNRPNFDFPESDLASPSFGQIFNTVQPLAGLASGGPGDPREIQLGWKFLW